MAADTLLGRVSNGRVGKLILVIARSVGCWVCSGLVWSGVVWCGLVDAWRHTTTGVVWQPVVKQAKLINKIKFSSAALPHLTIVQ